MPESFQHPAGSSTVPDGLSRAETAGDAARLQHDLAVARAELVAERNRLANMRQSWSWRLTLPFRALVRLFQPRPAPAAAAAPATPSVTEIPGPAEATGVPAPPVEAPSGERAAAEPETPAPPAFRPRFALDLPSGREFAPGKVRFYGWCLGPEEAPPSAVRIRVGPAYFDGRVNILRPDVLAVLNLPESSLPCGFDAFIDLGRGPSQVLVEALFLGENEWRKVDEFEVVAADSAEGRREWRAYREWIKKHDAFDGAARDRLAAKCEAIEKPVTISVLLPAWNTPEDALRRAIESVRQQVYPHWQLCLVDDASPQEHVRRLLESYAAMDPRVVHRVRSEQGNISVATNTALELATGEWIAFLDHDDEYHPAALACVALEIAAHPEAELIYTDEDKVNVQQERSLPHFKPDWDPELLVGQNYICHLVAMPADRLRALGGLRSGFEGCQDWDLLLRATEARPSAKVRHIPRVLYHWRILPGSMALGPYEKDKVSERAKQALLEHFDRCGEPIAEIVPVTAGLWQVIRRVPAPEPRVSIVIPTRDRLDLLGRCVDSLRAHTSYPNFEIIIIDNQSTDAETLARLQEWSDAGIARVFRYDAPFNYSAMHNFVVPQCAGEFICMLNNDTEVSEREPHWLTHMMAQAIRPGVGVVGAMLLYPDDSIQHAGTILGLGGIGDHRHALEPRFCEGHMGRLRAAHQLSAVTAACMVFRKSIFIEVAGLDQTNLAVTYNDVDFCLRVLDAGYRNIWTPLAVLYHHESASRGFADTPAKRARFRNELQYMLKRWGDRLDVDPAYNPNFTLHHKDGGLAAIPRIEPW